MALSKKPATGMEVFLPVVVQIRDYVRRNYPDAAYVSYEIDRNSYEVTLSNRLELKFNSRFALVEIDD